MSFVYPVTSDPVIGSNDPMYSNTWDAVNIEIEHALEVEHTADGAHTTFSALAMVCEVGTYTGNGTADRTVLLSNTNLTPLYMEVWDAVMTPILVRSSLMGVYTKEMAAFAFASNEIIASGLGNFHVGTTANVNGRVYYYSVLGSGGSMSTGNCSSFTPSWIQHGESIALDTNNDGAPMRASKEILTKFRVNHNDSGTHKTATFQQFSAIEVGQYTGNGVSTSKRTITLATANLFPKMVMVWGNTTKAPVFRRAEMDGANLIATPQTTPTLGWISDLATGSFKLSYHNPEVNGNGIAYYYLVIGNLT